MNKRMLASGMSPRVGPFSRCGFRLTNRHMASSRDGTFRPAPESVTAAWFRSEPPELLVLSYADGGEPGDGDGERGAGPRA